MTCFQVDRSSLLIDSPEGLSSNDLMIVLPAILDVIDSHDFSTSETAHRADFVGPSLQAATMERGF